MGNDFPLRLVISFPSLLPQVVYTVVPYIRLDFHSGAFSACSGRYEVHTPFTLTPKILHSLSLPTFKSLQSGRQWLRVFCRLSPTYSAAAHDSTKAKIPNSCSKALITIKRNQPPPKRAS